MAETEKLKADLKRSLEDGGMPRLYPSEVETVLKALEVERLVRVMLEGRTSDLKYWEDQVNLDVTYGHFYALKESQEQVRRAKADIGLLQSALL